jgi:dTDP-4-amino-4,6-dideoxygalactose transaminase
VEDRPYEVPIVELGDGRIPLFTPHVPASAATRVTQTLSTRWIGQGPQVDSFEERFQHHFCGEHRALAVGSGTDALHLAYLLAGIGPGDEVVTPVFTCTATNIPLRYLGATPVFADIEPQSLNVDPAHVRSLMSERTKAIICVDYGGLPCDLAALREIADEYEVPLIEDSAQALGATFDGRPVGSIADHTIFSFQAIKHITTGDGGMLSIRDHSKVADARSLRWFGINREKKQLGVWENDITLVGFKYQMTDIGAAMGHAALDEWDDTLALRRDLFDRYVAGLVGAEGVTVLSLPDARREHAAWLFTIAVDDRRSLQDKLYSRGIEANQVHYRNDRYSIFGQRRDNLPAMDAMEERYLVLPLHTRMTVDDVDRVCETIRSGW